MAQATLDGPDIYAEDFEAPSPRIEVTRDGRKIFRELILANGDVNVPDFSGPDSLILELFPPRAAPGRYPAPNSIFYAETAAIQPIGTPNGASNGVGSSHYWKASITYSPLPYAAPGWPSIDPILQSVERNWAGGGEIMTLPGSQMYWEGDDETDGPTGEETIPAIFTLTTIQHSHTRRNLVENGIPYAAMRAVAGRVNATAFPANHPIFPGIGAEQLLFENWDIGFQFASDGTMDFSVVLNFKERAAIYDETVVGWNHVWDQREGQQKFRKIFRDPKPAGDDQSKPMYELAPISAFNVLFQ